MNRFNNLTICQTEYQYTKHVITNVQFARSIMILTIHNKHLDDFRLKLSNY